MFRIFLRVSAEWAASGNLIKNRVPLPLLLCFGHFYMYLLHTFDGRRVTFCTFFFSPSLRLLHQVQPHVVAARGRGDVAARVETRGRGERVQHAAVSRISRWHAVLQRKDVGRQRRRLARQGKPVCFSSRVTLILLACISARMYTRRWTRHRAHQGQPHEPQLPD